MDRNDAVQIVIVIMHASLSARRAWIEIIGYIIDYVNDAVALRKESVDRNMEVSIMYRMNCQSLSARRAWIEIVAWLDYSEELLQSLSARRAWIEIDIDDKFGGLMSGRSPQGERG